MRGWLNCVAVILGVSTALCSAPSVYADAQEAQAGLAVGTLQSALKSSLYILNKEISDIAYNAYQQGRGAGTEGAEDVSNPSQNWVSVHRQFYCSPTIIPEKTAFKCQAPNTATPEEAKYLEMGDVKASALYGPSVYYSPALDLAAQDFIRKMGNPYPTSKYADSINSSGFLNSTPDTKAYARYMANQAVLTVALNSFNHSYATRVPGSNIGANPAGSSIMSIIENEANRRFADPSQSWFAALGGYNELQTLQEIAAMEAFRLWLDFQQYKQNERIEALLAATLSKVVVGSLAQDAMMPAGR